MYPYKVINGQSYPGLLLTKRTDVLPQDPVKSRSQAIECNNDGIILKCGWHLHSTAAEVPVKLQSDWKRLNSNLVASSFHVFMRSCNKTSVYLVNRGPTVFCGIQLSFHVLMLIAD